MNIDQVFLPPIRRKAFAYITSRERLLLFTHPWRPEAGIQVPAGTVEPHEQPVHAVMREASEETGLKDLRLGAWLGRQVFDARPYGRDELHDRWFWHVIAKGDVSESWRHGELFASDGTSGEIPFDFFWADLREPLPYLIADHGRFIPELKHALTLSDPFG